MRKNRYTLDELLEELRGKGFSSIADVKYAILENSGQLSVLPWNDQAPPTAAQLHLQPEDDVTLPVVLIDDGRVLSRRLAACGKDEAWLQNALHGDFGISYKYKMDVLEVIRTRLPYTLRLGGVGFVLLFVLSLGVGVLCARHEDSLLDRILCRVGTVMSCVPEFWLSLVLILLFAVELRWLPSSGAYSVGGDGGFADRAVHLILPVTVVVLGHLWYYAYLVRSRLIEELHADYILLAKGKGLPKRTVLLRHALRNVLPSYLSIMAISVPHILGGTYIVETVFSYPGLGTLSYESARYQDYNLLMVLCMMTGAAVIVCNLLAQAISARIDPRLAGEEAAHG